MRVKFSLVFLFFIIILSIFLRFYKLGQNPPSLTWDEASWGYNAYTLGLDGRDEFGKFLPITYIESFGDFKPPTYAYLASVPVGALGLNEFATRFPSAFFGVMTILITFFLTREIFKTLKGKDLFYISLLSSLILAISPWHILLSRAAFEANIATFFIALGILLFLKATSGNKWLIVLSLAPFIFSMYTFNTARIVAPLIFVVLTIGKRKFLLQMKKQAIVAFIVGFILFLPLGIFLNTPQAKLRFSEVNIFSNISIVEKSNQEIKNDGDTSWSKIIHNRRVTYALEYVKHYLDNLNPTFLFIKGDGNPKFSIQDVGQMYIWEIPFFITGFLFLFRKRDGDWWIIPLWLVISIIPAGTARETPHALRIEGALPTFQIVTAYGLYYLISRINFKLINLNIKKITTGLIILFAAGSFVYFFHNYFVHYPREFSGEWQYGYKDAINYAENNKNKYDKIWITDKLGRPYIYILYYSKFDPQEFRKTASVTREAFGFVHVNSFSNYDFSNDKDKLKGKILYIESPNKVPKNKNILKKFYLLNGEEVLVAYTD